ncbi:MAG: MBL fold metallo-hydrolase [Synergistaceae bacterium]|nr:MBL fold metallo-hydrolase [Synergistaceae bacterium]
MKIHFLGAAGEVTGSCYLIESGGERILVDCGVHQGEDERKDEEPLPLAPGEIDAILLTHAHMDHSGRIPWLVKEGFKGTIWTTSATAQMVDILWHDSARLMGEEAEWRTRKALRRGGSPVQPLYGDADVARALARLAPVGWGERHEPCKGVVASFHDAGHILGSSSIQLDLTEDGRTTRVVFSGDLGQQRAVVGRAPSIIEEADYVLIESTYGDRLHKDEQASREEFRDAVLTALRDRSKVLIPSFVVDRAQRILFELSLMQVEGILPEVPIFLDSPMGVRATDLYRSHIDTLSSEIQRMAASGIDPFAPKGFKDVTSPDDSRAINDVPSCIVIAGSGMCSGGRIVHHLKHGAWDPKAHIVFVGYQAWGTLGRRIVEREPKIRIGGEEVAIRAQVHTIGGFSAHADRDDLLAWAGNFTTSPLFLVTHGEPKASQALAVSLQEAGMRALVPTRGQELTIVPGSPIKSAAARAPSAPALQLLDDIASLVDRLRRAPGLRRGPDEAMHLLAASRTLLDTALRDAEEES